MKKFIPLLVLLFFLTTARAQWPEMTLTLQEVEAPLRFLASDELQGRRTGSEGNDIAARFLANYFEAYGLETLPGLEGYFQPLRLQKVMPTQQASLTIGNEELMLSQNFILVAGDAADLKTTGVFAGHGWVSEDRGQDDYQGVDVTGKVVFVLPGTPDGDDSRTVFRASRRKRQLAAERGAVALIELHRLRFPWPLFVRYFSKPSLTVVPKEAAETGSGLVYGWLKEKDKNFLAGLIQGEEIEIRLTSEATKTESSSSQNVVGMIEGTDPELKDEYLLLTAHYDHVGTGLKGSGAFSEADSIFNGARDNAMGTVALLSAAKALAQQPPKRSVIFLAVTGEEVGLLGSSYYAEYPLVPLEKTIFNLNTDGAGYNDTRYVSIIGYGRTGTDEQVIAGVTPFGLAAFPDPAPEQGLFDRSDNVAFATKGMPALTFSPGFTGFDEEINRYYHQVTDEAETIDFSYLLKYCQAYAHTARQIADRFQRPWWISGDKYEGAGKSLYKR